jgi:hypothetical protein
LLLEFSRTQAASGSLHSILVLKEGIGMSSHPSIHLWRKVLLGVTAVSSIACLCAFPVLASQAAAGKAQQEKAQQEKVQQEERKDTEVPKPPKDDFTVQIYKALDGQKATSLKAKDKYKQDKTEEDVEIVLSYFNWALSEEDYWNRQITIDTKTTDGFVIEKLVKSGFGDFGYVKPGDTKTQDVYRKEKITVTGNQATATMADAEIGAPEKERFRKLLEKLVLKK